jgi:hypothetical protein
MGWSARFDVKLRSGMEISDLMPQFMQNHDRILAETIERTLRVKNTGYFPTKAGKFLINRQGI